MNKSKQRIAAIASVAVLGLVVSGTFGGAARADTATQPLTFPLRCDLDGNARHDTRYIASHYEQAYTFVSTDDEATWHDPKSHAWFTQEERIDVLQATYQRLTGPGGQQDPDPATSFTDLTVEWFDVYYAPEVYADGKPKGPTVLCINVADPYEYTIPAEEAALDAEKRIVAGATYAETDYQLFEIGLRGAPGKPHGHGRGHGRNGHSLAHKQRGKH